MFYLQAISFEDKELYWSLEENKVNSDEAYRVIAGREAGCKGLKI
jgi:hypothetical protein